MQTAFSLALEQFGQRMPMHFISYGGGGNTRRATPPQAAVSPGAGILPGPRTGLQDNTSFVGQPLDPFGPGAIAGGLSNVYTPFDFDNDVLTDVQEEVTRGLFSGNTGSFVNMFTSSLLTATQKTYYQELHSNGDPALTNDAVSELSIAYGHVGGSGSRDLTGNLNNDTPSRGIYSQYAQLLLDPGDRKFTFNGVNSDSIYVLNFNRARFRERIDAGNFEITLSRLSGSIGTEVSNAGHTGSNVRIAQHGQYFQIVDDSSANNPTVGQFGPIYNLVSGSLDNTTQGQLIHNPSAPVHYGLLYPHLGIAVLNAEKLDEDYSTGGLNFNSVTGSHNAVKLFTALSSSNGMTPVNINGGIQARSMERVKASYYFCRVRNAEYNYSNNKSFTTGSGAVAYESFADNPQVYITTVGMYNNNRELLAVAKLSQPILKNFTREALIKVKLNF